MELRLEQVEQRQGAFVHLYPLDLTLVPRAVTVLLGATQAGKTSLINMLSGVYRPDAGSIRLDGVELAGLPTHCFAAAGIGRTFQNLQVFFNMTALENVMTGRYLREQGSLLASLLQNASVGEKQAALQALGDLRHPTAVAVLVQCFDRLDKGDFGAVLHLDLFDHFGLPVQHFVETH